MPVENLPDDWSEAQNILYVKVHRFMSANKNAMSHPQAPVFTDEHWQTVCHNAAFLAAEMLETDSLRILDVDTEEVIAESPGRLNG